MNQKSLLLTALVGALLAPHADAAFNRSANATGAVVNATRGVDVVLYSQLDAPAGNGVPDQDFEASFDAYDSFAADDFVVTDPSGWTINSIGTVGTTGTPGGATVSVRFYANSVGGGDPDLPNLADVRCTYTGLVPVDTLGSFAINLPTSCILPPGAFWVEIQTSQNFGSFGQHFWSNRSTQSNSESVWRNPGNGFASGCTTYAPATVCGVGGGASPDLLFSISGQPGGFTQPMTSNPPSGAVALPQHVSGGAATTTTITYTNPNAAAGTVTCTQPMATQFTVNPAVVNVPGNGNAGTTVSFASATAGNFNGTLNCSGSNGESFTYNLSGTAVAPITSTPSSPATINFGNVTAGGGSSSQSIVFTNPGAAAATVTCTAPTAAQFTANPLVINLPANGSSNTTVTFASAGIGTFSGTMTCSGSGGEAFTFSLNGTAGVSTPVPALSDLGRWLAILAAFGIGLVALRRFGSH